MSSAGGENAGAAASAAAIVGAAVVGAAAAAKRKRNDGEGDEVKLCDVCELRSVKAKRKQCGICSADVTAARRDADGQGKLQFFLDLQKKKIMTFTTRSQPTIFKTNQLF